MTIGFVFWLSSLCFQTTNPMRNMIWKIFLFVHQPICRDFQKQCLPDPNTNFVAAFHPTLPIFAAGPEVYDLTTTPPTLMHRFKYDELCFIRAVALYDHFLFIATFDTMSIYDLTTLQHVIEYNLNEQEIPNFVNVVAFHPNLPLFAFGSQNQTMFTGS